MLAAAAAYQGKLVLFVYFPTKYLPFLHAWVGVRGKSSLMRGSTTLARSRHTTLFPSTFLISSDGDNSFGWHFIFPRPKFRFSLVNFKFFNPLAVSTVCPTSRTSRLAPFEGRTHPGKFWFFQNCTEKMTAPFRPRSRWCT